MCLRQQQPRLFPRKNLFYFFSLRLHRLFFSNSLSVSPFSLSSPDPGIIEAWETDGYRWLPPPPPLWAVYTPSLPVELNRDNNWSNGPAVGGVRLTLDVVRPLITHLEILKRKRSKEGVAGCWLQKLSWPNPIKNNFEVVVLQRGSFRLGPSPIFLFSEFTLNNCFCFSSFCCCHHHHCCCRLPPD